MAAARKPLKSSTQYISPPRECALNQVSFDVRWFPVAGVCVYFFFLESPCVVEASMVPGTSVRLRCYAGTCLICVSLAAVFVFYGGDQTLANKRHAWFPKANPANGTTDTQRQQQRKPVTILFWTAVFDSQSKMVSGADSGLVSYNSCSVPCFLTRDRALIRSADAVVIHDRDANGRDLPRYRAEHQRWVYWNMEAPPNSRPEKMASLRGVFNWTYTYRRDSDVPHPYFFVRSVARRSTAPPAEHTPTFNRSGLVAWVASNCRTSSRRETFVDELRKHIAVDTFGSCGNLACPRNEDCFARLGKRYYFYLSLENAVCPDYVTEKLYNALHYGMVPVVMGSYSASLAPPGSCIDALRFASPERLAAYLKAVAADPTQYEAYFAWKKTHEVRYLRFRDHCLLCEALSRASPDEHKTYEDIVEWWHGNRSICKRWKPESFVFE
ncbi:alpha-(1,3)-fucosyltransferase 7-like isoform X2 [Dermacentor variabilis]|uniref:alpha-(1,3)-fucosyltransferase 7-like isoform X2 n=1 Tax=Dermacentor variabilis TaxID=34621 RepID=UPI003F5C52BE